MSETVPGVVQGFRLKNLRRRVTRSDAFVAFVAGAASLFVRALWKTLRAEVVEHPLPAGFDPRRVIYGFWHGRYLLLLPAFRNRGITVLTELSWAGRVQGRITRSFGFRIVLGSSRRKAVRALAEMKRAIEDGSPGAFTLDGPRGPIHRSKPGVLLLAKKLGAPIIPAATTADRAWVLAGTWDRFLVPKPFAKVYVATGPPIPGSAEGTLTLEELDRVIAEFTADADRHVGREDEAAP
jgi:lysophospholipid acyltransferase (LPLAT)-like uncharacterized protein